MTWLSKSHTNTTHATPHSGPKPIHMEFFIENWAEIALAVITLAGTITALTETKKDDAIVDVLKRILDAETEVERQKRHNARLIAERDRAVKPVPLTRGPKS